MCGREGKYSRINIICCNVFAFFFVKMRNKKRIAVYLGRFIRV
nr:MAG TPA: Protein of unknown function (DUF1361) [Caudoviricetes sp.]